MIDNGINHRDTETQRRQAKAEGGADTEPIIDDGRMGMRRKDDYKFRVKLLMPGGREWGLMRA
jgi:hypothetical protein